MGFFSKKKGVVDLGALYNKQKEKSVQLRKQVEKQAATSDATPINTGAFGFFNMGNNNSEVVTPIIEESSEEGNSPEEKRRRLAKRLKDMTDKIENLSNEIYHLQQRVEVLERKNSSTLYQ